MNKKLNTLLFVLGATLLNMVLMVFLFLVGFVVHALVLAPKLSPELNSLAMLLLFALSIVGTYFLYHRLMKFLSRRIDWEKYFAPLMGKSKPRKPDR